MNSSTNVGMVGLAAGITTIIIWLTGYYLPDLMAAAPAGLEAGITAIITVLTGYLAPEKSPKILN